MSDQLFSDSVMQLVLQFSNPNKRDILEADKSISHMSLGLRDIVANSLKAGMSVAELSSQVQKLASTLKNMQGVDPSVAGQAQRILNRYTPERIETVGNVTAMRQNLGVESSTTASLHAALEKFLRTQNDQQRVLKEKRGELYAATGNNPVGRGLFIDVETARDPTVDKPAGYRQDPKVAAAIKAQQNHVLEVAATLFSFDKQTGRILNAGEEVYHSYNDLSETLKQANLNLGKLTRDMVAGHSLNPLAIAAMASKADFLVGHNVRQFDQPVLAKHVPILANMPTLDTMRDVPWRNLGFDSRHLQDLLRMHDLSPGTAHRASDDVAANLKLIAGNHPSFGGPSYMSMMLGAQGPITDSQQIASVIRSNAEHMRERLIAQLGESPRYFGQPQVVRGPAHPEENEEYARNVIHGVEGGLTARGIRGSGGTADATPQGNLGQAAIAVQNRLNTVNEFLRHATVMSGPAASTEFLSVFSGQAKYQDKIQQYGGTREGRRFRTERDKRSGEDVMIAAMSGFNTQMRNRDAIASGDAGYSETRGLGTIPETAAERWAAHHARNMLAAPTSGQVLLPSGVDEQGKKFWQPSQTPLGRDWAGSTRPMGPSQYSDAQIKDFIEQHRGTGRAPIQRASDMASSVGENDSRFKELTELVYAAQESNRNERRGQRAGVRTPRSAPKPFGSERGGFNLEDLYNTVFGKAAAGPSRDPVAELRQLRRDDSIARLYASANKAADALEQYASVVAPQKRRAIEDRFNAAQEKATAKLEQDLGKTDLRASNQQTRVQSRIESLGLGSDKIQDTLVSRRESLRLNELMANVKLDKSEQDAQERLKRIRSSELTPAQQSIAAEKVAESLKIPRFNAGLAAYRVESFEAQTPEEVANLRQSHAEALSNIVGGQYKDSLMAALPTPRGGYVDSAAAQARNKARQDELSGQKSEIEKEAQRRRDQINADFAKGRISSEEERDRRLGVVNQAGRNLSGNLVERAYSARDREGRARQRFALEDEIAGGGGGGRGGRGGGSGSLGGGARGALDFGLGLAAFAGAATSLRELTLETAQYAARTQQLKVVTEQMAKTNFVAVDSIGAYVNVMKGQNQTTQSAYSTIQRMTQAQLDITKAPALGKAAQNLSTLTGSDPSETLDRIMMGLVTGYTRQLHMAGLQVSRLNVNRELRGELGREPNEFEQRQALFNAVLTESARTAGTYQQSLTTAAGQMARLSVQAQETKNTIGNQFLPLYGRGISLVNSGLRTIQDNPTGSSRAIAGGIGVGSALGAIGTAAFLRWGLGAAGGVLGGPGGVGIGLTAAAIGTGVYETLTQNPMRLKAQAARESLRDMDRERSQLTDAVPLGPNPTEGAKKQFDFEHKQFVESEKGYADSRIAIQKNLTTDLAQIYMQQVKDFDDLQDKLWATKGGQGFTGAVQGIVTGIANLVTTGSGDGAGTKGGKMARPKPVDLGGGVVITTDDQLKAIDNLRKQAAQALHPDATASYNQLRIAQAMSTIKQAEAEVDTLDRGYEPGGKEARASFRARNSDNPLGLIQAEAADRKAKLQQDLDGAKKVLEDAQATNTNGGLDLAPAIANARNVQNNRKDEIDKINKEAAEQSAALIRKRNQQFLVNAANLDISGMNANVIPGNYASEFAASATVTQRERTRAQAEFALHQNPIQRDLELGLPGRVGSIEVQQREREQALVERQRNAQRQRQESFITAGGQFAAQTAMNDPRLSTQQAIIKGYQAEMQAAGQLSNDEERRNQQLQLTLKLRESLVEAARNEAREGAETLIARHSDQARLQETVARISAGRGNRGNEQLAMEAIERRRSLEVGQAQFAYGQRLAVGGAGDQAKLARERDEAIDRANTEATAARLEQLERVRDTRRQELSQVYQRQGQNAERIEVTQARGPADEMAAVQNVHQIRLQYIQLEYEARGKTLDAEKDRNRSRLDEDLQYAEKIQEMQKQKYEESRNFSGGLFDALSHSKSEPFAVPRFFGGFLEQQGKTVFENATAPIVNNAMASMAKSFGPQFTTDANGRQTPTALGRILGGTVLGQVPGDPTKALAEVTRESTNAQNSLKDAIVSLDTAIRAVGGLSAPTTGTASSAGGLANPLSMLGSLIPGAAPLIKSASAVIKIPQISGLFSGGSTASYASTVASTPMDDAVRQVLGGGTATPGLLASVSSGLNLGKGFANNIFMQGGGSTLAAAAQQSGGGLTINVAAPEAGTTNVGTGIPGDAGGSFLKNFLPGAMADYAGTAAPPAIAGGEVPVRMADSTNGNGMLIGGKMLQDGALVTPPSGRNVVNGYVQPGNTFGQNFAQGLGAFGASIGHADLASVFTGHANVPGTDPGTAEMHLNTAQRAGGALGAAATVIGGTEVALSNFKKGSVKGDIGGIGGILSAASVIPGPQQPFVMAGAALAGLVSQFLPDPKLVRQAQISSYLQTDAYRAPVSLDATIAASGGDVVSEGLNGLGRNSGLAAFPFNVQQNRLMAQSNPSLLGYMFGSKNYTNSLFPYAQGYNYLPGRQLAPTTDALQGTGPYAGGGMEQNLLGGGFATPLYANGPTSPGASNPNYISPSAVAARASAPAPTNVTVNIPISSMDSTDVLRRSPDIAAALVKELQAGGGVNSANFYINQAVFGAG